MEERLISSAFYNLSMQMHRTAVENRLSNVHASSSQVDIKHWYFPKKGDMSLTVCPDFASSALVLLIFT